MPRPHMPHTIVTPRKPLSSVLAILILAQKTATRLDRPVAA